MKTKITFEIDADIKPDGLDYIIGRTTAEITDSLWAATMNETPWNITVTQDDKETPIGEYSFVLDPNDPETPDTEGPR